eukprot:CAMPEP_0197925354 /NCGR_PEP_ID=MMETSP1439-20131203/97287_1 /TAXON_ID=66791 /ORGANISM="Gonyaulax spinifera, Strain CCMP409" /LENGTH=103 /DNA_ID=CAMNT_0043547831 /DNA_START=200 /DNA_END=511 /DNA_ORIENTATION=+
MNLGALSADKHLASHLAGLGVAARAEPLAAVVAAKTPQVHRTWIGCPQVLELGEALVLAVQVVGMQCLSAVLPLALQDGVRVAGKAQLKAPAALLTPLAVEEE